MEGRELTFRLVGINNQNFVMQDAETGTWWQQVTGEAILGPLKGRRLALVPFDQLTYGVWRGESPGGRVLVPDPRITAQNLYATADWELQMQEIPTPVSANDLALPPRALVIGIAIGDAARAYSVEDVAAARVVLDDLGGTAIAIVRAPDGRSTRVFDRVVDGRALDLLADPEASPFRLIDADTGTAWDFTGLAVDGPLKGRRLTRLPFLEEYWFDWKTYNPSTDVARHVF